MKGLSLRWVRQWPRIPRRFVVLTILVLVLLALARESSYAYDRVDNLTQKVEGGVTTSASYNSLNQLTQFGGQTFSYDANGNTLSDSNRNYQWDAADRLTEVVLPSAGTKVEYAYDGLGRRIKARITGSTGTSEQRSLWCGTRLCQLRDGQDTPIGRLYEEGEYRTDTGKPYLYLPDHLGSVRDVIDVSTGSLVAALDYAPYGQIKQQWGSVTPTMQFAQLQGESLTGLNLSFTRSYDGAIGRWLNRDPIKEDGGTNLYGYVGANPVMLSDSIGMEPPPHSLSKEKILKNIEKAKGLSNPRNFRDLVKNKGPWDYKQMDPKLQDFGNYNYGATGAASGLFSLDTLQKQAGKAQCAAGTSNKDWGTPDSGPPYGDDPNDQKWIEEGWKDYMSGMYGPPEEGIGLMRNLTDIYNSLF
jgi:RHS repeat-associated protein